MSDSEATRLVGEIHRLAPFPAEFKEAEVMKRLRAAETKTKRGKSLGDQFAQPAGEPCTVTDGRPQIIVTTEEHVATERAVAALGNATEVYQRGGTLVHVVRDDCLPSFLSRPKDSPRIVSLPLPRLREILSREAAWFTYNRKGEMKPSRVDGECVKQAAARGSWPGIRRLEGITEAPMLRPDGSVVTAPGYDRATGLLFVPNLAMPLIKPEPSRDDAQAAAQELLDVVCDFHFASEAHKSGWLASVLTPFARHAFEGCVPLFMIDKNVRGAGGGLLANTIGIITTGRDMAAMPAATDDSEWRKRITSIAVEALPMVLIDNIAGRFGWPSLDAALTSTIWSDRLLKENKNAKARLQTIWYATANNVALQADTARRCLHIRIETDLERPEQRTDFVHADLKAHVRRIRGDLVRAALTILRAYFVAGCPEMQLVEWGSFEQWSRLIRGAITWLGLADPGTTRLELAKQSDVEANAAANLIHAWLRAYASASKSTAEVLHNVHQSEDAEFRELRDALCEFMRCKADDLPTATSFSMKLHHMRQRVIDGCRFESENDSTIDPCAANVRRHNFSSAAWKKERLRG
ncbi:MAG: hypothetical protein SGJ19_27695 [Planctomycetia bacterium]|nr:hypothetical protein [Planctomycetia bacterium]